MCFLCTCTKKAVLPGSTSFPSRIPDPGFRIKEFKCFNPKNCFYALGNMIQDVHPGSGSWFFTHPGSRIQGSKKHRIPDPDPHHWYLLVLRLRFRIKLVGFEDPVGVHECLNQPNKYKDQQKISWIKIQELAVLSGGLKATLEAWESFNEA